jgi:3-oxoacyl-[acyl-carrier protein] reductase
MVEFGAVEETMSILLDRVALVSGGSRGIGRAIALRLAQAGADVVIAYRAAESEAASVVEEIERAGRRTLAVRADVANANETAALAQRVFPARKASCWPSPARWPGKWDSTASR